MNNAVPPQFTEGPVNAEFSGVLQVNSHQEVHHKGGLSGIPLL